MSNFTFEHNTKIEFGINSINKIPNIIKKLKCKNVMCVTDQGLVKSGVFKQLTDILINSQINFVEFTEVEADPSTKMIEKAAKISKDNNVDMLIAIGGGSPIDTAKGIRIIMDNNVKLEDCSGVEKVDRISTPMIAIPTTAGTGSEVTKFAVLSDLEKDLKFTVTSGLICPDYAILDPQLTIGLPAGITAATGFDALTHAIEALTSIIAQPLTDVISFESIKLIFDWLPKAVNQGTDLEARSEMLKAQLYAGIAFNNAFLGLSHAIASPLGAHCHIPHGLANAVMLSYVVKYNVPAAADKYAKAYDIIKNNVSSEGKYDKGYQFVKEIENLNKLCSLPSKLSEIGVDKKKLDLVAEDALKSGMLKFNVRSADKKQIREILEEAY